jgi:hypothetical protein
MRGLEVEIMFAELWQLALDTSFREASLDSPLLHPWFRRR